MAAVMANVDIYEAAGLTDSEVLDMANYIDGTKDSFYDSPAYEKLYEYFAFETNEMPYGVAKARTGDPDQWILDFLWDDV